MDLLYWMKTNNTWLTPKDIFAHSTKVIPAIVIAVISILLGTIGNIFTILAIIFTKVISIKFVLLSYNRLLQKTLCTIES